MDERIDIMVDIESLDTKSTCVVLSVGAVPFSIEKKTTYSLESFYVTIDIKSGIDSGRTIAEHTLLWWMKQDTESKKVFFEKDRLHIDEFKLAFANWIKFFSLNYDRIVVWAKGPSFDISVLDNVYDYKTPYHFREVRDVRTIIDLYRFLGLGDEGDYNLDGPKHNALHDAIYQANMMIGMINKIKEAIHV